MKKFSTPKKFLTAAAVAAGLFFAVSSCKKSSSTNSVTITETQAAELTEDAVNPSTGGMVTQINNSAVFCTNANLKGNSFNQIHTNSVVSCGVIKDTTAAYASTAGSVPAYTYSLTWQNSIACTTPATFSSAFQGKGTYTGLFLTSNFNSAGAFSLSGLTAADASYTFNSNFERQGTTSTRQGTIITFNHTLSISSTNIIYNKTSQEITSGTAAVSVIVTNTAGKSWTYTGTLTFLGNKTAKLVFASGAVYNITWS